MCHGGLQSLGAGSGPPSRTAFVLHFQLVNHLRSRTSRRVACHMKRFPSIAFAAAVLLLIYACQSAPSESAARSQGAPTGTVSVMTSGGFTAAYNVLGPQFEKATGVRLTTAYGASSGGAPDSIPVRLARGEPADLIILSRSSLDNLTRRGDVVRESCIDLVDSTIGMAVRSGATKPDISSPDAFIAVLLAASSIGYSASASGTYLSTVLFPRLGIWEQLEPKSRRVVGERVASVVARGEVAIGFQQISEILPIEGVDYVGPIPAELQRVTTFSAGLTARASNHEDARALLEFLSSEAVAETIAATGLEPRVWKRLPQAAGEAPR